MCSITMCHVTPCEKHGMKKWICTEFAPSAHFAPSANVAIAAIASSLQGCKSFANLKTKIVDGNTRMCTCTTER